MKYKCLILDHDDTVVNSTATIHYPCFIEFLKIYRPNMVHGYTFEDFILKNFKPGILSLLCDEILLSEDELAEEGRFWDRYVNTRIPTAYEGFSEILQAFRGAGGIVAVSSHSMEKYIIRDYKSNGLLMPDEIYGWDIGKERRKPSAFAVYDLIEKYGFDKSEILMVDDLKPGFDMAREAGIDFAAAGWGYNVFEIEKFMRAHSDFYLTKVEELSRLLMT